MRDFGPDDLDVATAFYRAIGDPKARAVLDFLVDHPGQRFDGAAIAAHLGFERHRDVARSTYGLGEAAAALGRRRPWHEAQLGYSMAPELAALFVRARAEAGV